MGRKRETVAATMLAIFVGRASCFAALSSGTALRATSVRCLSRQCSRTVRLQQPRHMMMSTSVDQDAVAAVKADIAAAGDKIRSLKAEKADKSAVQPHVDSLLALKAKYESITGEPFDVPKVGAKDKSKKQQQQKPAAASQTQKKGAAVSSDQITPRAQDYSQWYLDVIAAAEMVDNSPVKGCMVIRPWGMAIWDAFRTDLDTRIKANGVDNAYFPLFIPRSFLSKEAEHVEGFAKECAVVTHHRLCADPSGSGQLIPDPDAKLEEPLVVRPTRYTEGHTAHASKDEALGCARDMLDMYADSIKDMLAHTHLLLLQGTLQAVPVVKGTKSPMERFAGADETFTIEGMMQNGWALQSGTSHFLGQNFARAFDVFFQTKEETRELVWATSWGVSTRLMGALVMTHADDAGLRLPPAVAPHQVVVVPITKGEGQETDLVYSVIDKAVTAMKAKGIRVKVDNRDHLRPGAKYFEWERKGVPLRLEVGPRDAKNGVLTLVKRTGGDKTTIQLSDDDTFVNDITTALDDIHTTLWNEVRATCTSSNQLDHMVSGDSTRIGFYLVPWSCNASREKEIQEDCKATIRCYPLKDNEAGDYNGKSCFYSDEPATHMALFARSF
eukprot:7079-Heterococcus_DN1.PRE.2